MAIRILESTPTPGTQDRLHMQKRIAASHSITVGTPEKILDIRPVVSRSTAPTLPTAHPTPAYPAPEIERHKEYPV